MRYQPRADVLFQQVDDQAVLLSLGDEVYFGLNETAARIWRRLEESPATVEELVALLAAAYPDAPSTELRADVAELLDALVAGGLASRHGAAAAAPALLSRAG